MRGVPQEGGNARGGAAGLGLLAPPTASRCLAAPPASREGGGELQSFRAPSWHIRDCDKAGS